LLVPLFFADVPDVAVFRAVFFPALDWFPATAGVSTVAGAPDIAAFLLELATLLLLSLLLMLADVAVCLLLRSRQLSATRLLCCCRCC
jgi:hypothetical protein